MTRSRALDSTAHPITVNTSPPIRLSSPPPTQPTCHAFILCPARPPCISTPCPLWPLRPLPRLCRMSVALQSTETAWSPAGQAVYIVTSCCRLHLCATSLSRLCPARMWSSVAFDVCERCTPSSFDSSTERVARRNSLRTERVSRPSQHVLSSRRCSSPSLPPSSPAPRTSITTHRRLQSIRQVQHRPTHLRQRVRTTWRRRRQQHTRRRPV